MALTKVTTNAITDDAITSDKVADGVISAADVADGTLTNAKLADGTLTNAKLADGTLTNAKVSASAAIDYSKLNLTGNIALADLSATGTKDATTFLRGDNTFAEAGGGVDGIVSSADATAMTISSNENVGIGITDPDSYESSARELVVGKTSGAAGITVRGATESNIYFADGTTGAEKYQGYVQYDHSGGRLNIGSGGSTHTSFDDSGTLQMGTTGTQASTPNIYIHAAGAMLFLRRKTTNGHIASFINTAGSVNGRIDIDGTNTTYATSSDYRLKENVDYNWDATTRLKQLKPARFNWISDDTNTLQDGFLAHEVSDVVPKAVIGNKDATETYTDEDGVEQTRPAYQSIDHSMLVPLLVKTIQELEARITELENA